MLRMLHASTLLPEEIRVVIRGFLWGDTSDWKQRLRNVLYELPAYGYHSLHDVASYTSNNSVIESEDCLYCGKCGEKAHFFALSFHEDACENCVIDTLMP